MSFRSQFLGFSGALMCLAAAAASFSASAAGFVASSHAELVHDWLTVLYSGDAARLDAVLADHFQVALGSGHGFVKSEALDVMPVVTGEPVISGLVATESGDLLVVRYHVEVSQKIEGLEQTRLAPRLTVFEKHADGWYVTAHASFAAPSDGK
jgi:ketosteroid isomerase-like protein